MNSFFFVSAEMAIPFVIQGLIAFLFAVFFFKGKAVSAANLIILKKESNDPSASFSSTTNVELCKRLR